MKIEIWREGYLDMGCEGFPEKARLVATVEDDDFKAACATYYAESKCYDSEDNTWWGCRLFDNEKDARNTSFG